VTKDLLFHFAITLKYSNAQKSGVLDEFKAWYTEQYGKNFDDGVATEFEGQVAVGEKNKRRWLNSKTEIDDKLDKEVGKEIQYQIEIATRKDAKTQASPL